MWNYGNFDIVIWICRVTFSRCIDEFWIRKNVLCTRDPCIQKFHRLPLEEKHCRQKTKKWSSDRLTLHWWNIDSLHWKLFIKLALWEIQLLILNLQTYVKLCICRLANASTKSARSFEKLFPTQREPTMMAAMCNWNVQCVLQWSNRQQVCTESHFTI